MFFFSEFIEFIDDYPTDTRNKRVVKLYKPTGESTLFKKRKDTRTITGVIETGRYGKEEDVIDIEKMGDKPVFKIHKNHAVQKPFFFLLCIPEVKKEGIIILEREGINGIRQVFSRLIKDFISDKYEDHIVRYSNFIDKNIVKSYVERGDLNSIKLTRHSLPVDIAERYGLDELEKDDFILELTLKTKRGRKIRGLSQKRIQNIFDDEIQSFFESQELKDLGFDEKSVIKVNSSYNDSTRTIDLSDTMKFKPYYKINIEIDKNGHSNFSSIESEALSLLRDLNLDLF